MEFIDNANSAPVDQLSVPNVRLVHTSYGFDIKLERRDPYGFVYVIWNKGPTPDDISGAYSDFDKARTAVVAYLGTGFNKPVDEPVVYEKAQYKKNFKKTEQEAS